MIRRASCVLALIAAASMPIGSWEIDNIWRDDDNIVMHDVFLPPETWSDPAQFQLSEWNTIDTLNASHPFRVAIEPEFSFGANDGDNTMGFLAEDGLIREYDLTYTDSLAWTTCWSFFGLFLIECDVMLDPSLPWTLVPSFNSWFQSTVLHEAGHVRGLNHYNGYLAMMNSGVSRLLRGETLYMDDQHAIRKNASFIATYDLALYPKWHDGARPQWMTLDATVVRAGDDVGFRNLTVENRGALPFDSPVRFGIYLSTDAEVTPDDQLLGTATYEGFPVYGFSTFDGSVTLPQRFADCATMYLGGVIDDDQAWDERYEDNNATVFGNGTPEPAPIEIRLLEDASEPNDSPVLATPVAPGYFADGLSLDTDDDEDYFELSLDTEATMRFAVWFLHENGDVDLELLDANGHSLAEARSFTDGEEIEVALTPGDVYLRVYGKGEGSCNPYRLDVAATECMAPQTPVSGLELSRADGVTRLAWQALVDGVFVNVYEGSSATVGALVDGAVDSCLLASTRATVLDVEREPPSGGLLFYLAVAGNSCGEGPAGDGLDGARSLDSAGDC